MAGGKTFTHLLAAAAAALVFAPALAGAADLIDQARSTGVVGEQADGYLGIVAGASAGADVKALVNQINIKRKAAYTELAAKRGVTIDDVAAATGCTQLSTKVKTGDYYRDAAGVWKKNEGSVALPSYCGK